MRGVLLVARLLLAAVFALAGFAKLSDREGTAKSIVDFGGPSVLARPMAWLLPVWELACAAALMVPATTRWAGVATFATLLVFIAAIALSLARGRRPDCHCFGQVHSQPVGWTTVARNAALAAVALFIAFQTPASADVAMTNATAGPDVSSVSTMLVWTALGLSSFTLFLAFQLLRQNGRLLVRIEAIEAKLGITPGQPVPQGLPIDSAAPGFTLNDLEGASVVIDPVRDLAGPTLLVFIEPGCTACDTLLPDVARWQRDHADRLKTMVISRGTIGQNRNKSAKHGIGNVLLQNDRETAQAYQVLGTPSAVLITDGRIASALASGADPIRELAAHAVVPRLRRGDPAPKVRLPDLRGQMTDVAAMRGRRTLLLFWNPTCGFCQRMLDDLTAWERHAPPDAPALLVISTGSPESNAQQGFRSPVLLDAQFKTAELFGVSGTPSAIMLDERSRIASDVGVGAESVLTLASSALTPATR
jgi:uncharacterized membrane protein YphA (DoxX/SURF4 family)/thiol-disulfide isomerase/thioredoxin